MSGSRVLVRARWLVLGVGVVLSFGCSRSRPSAPEGLRGQAQGVVNGPDFTVTSVSGPTSVLPGSGFSVAVTVCNIGNTTANTDVALVLSTDNVIAAPPDTILVDVPLGSLSPGLCVYPVLRVNANVPAGAYFLGAIANHQSPPDANPNNDALAGNQLGVGNGADFVVTAVSGPSSAQGSGFPGTVTVCNQGNASASTSVDLFLSSDATITPADTFAGTFPLGSLSPGQCVTQSVTFNAGVPPGAWYLGAIVNRQNPTPELIQTNDTQVGNLIGIGSGPDFVVTAVSGPPSAQGSFPGTVTVCNQGTAPGGTTVDLFLSQDATITTSDSFAGSFSTNTLSPGQCATQSVTFSAGVPMGAWYLGAIANSHNQVTELIQTNNAQAGGQIGIGSGPDLIVTAVSGPATVPGGGSLVTSVTVCNQGTVPSGGTTVDVRLSPGTSVTSSDYVISSVWVNGLTPGACATLPISGNAYVPEGAYHLGAFVDAGNSVSELIETNNTFQGAPIGVGFKPDFIISAVSGPSAALPGSGFTVSVTVCNQGTSSGSASVDLFLSTDANITVTDLPVGGLPPVNLNPNQCSTQSVPVSANVPPGPYFLGAIADSQNQVLELIETNNALAGNLLGVGSGPDFTVTAVSGPTVVGGGSFNVAVTVCNQGNVPGSPSVDVLLSPSANLAFAGPSAGSMPVGSLSPGQCATRTVLANVQVPNGTYFLAAIVDRQNQYSELIETNNALVGSQVGVGFLPDLVVSSVSGPTSVQGGAPFTAQVVVCNQGTVNAPSTSVDLKLSSGATITSGAYTSGNAFVAPLVVGQCATVSIPGNANVPQGPWYLGAIIDPQNQVQELFENNNAAAGLQMGIGFNPDFIVSAVSGPVSATGGSSFNVSVTVCNQGTTPGSPSLDVFLSTDATITLADSRVGGLASYGTLSPGQCIPLSVPVSASVPQGAYYLGAIVNSNNQVQELNPNNNSRTGNAIGIGFGPDLIVSAISSPPSTPGGSFTAQVTVCNQGTASSPSASVDLELLASAAATSGTFVGNAYVPGLSPGQCTVQPVNANISVPPGAYFVAALVDRNNQVAELIETNNSAVGGELGVGYGPDYYLSSVTYPSAVRPGASFTVQVTVCNQGTASGPSTSLDLYQSSSPTVTPASQHFGGMSIPGLNPGQCSTVPMTISLSGPDGSVYLGAIVNVQNQVSELLTDNNTRVGSPIAIDSVPPAVPKLASSMPASPSNNATPTFQGTAEPGATVKLFNGSCGGTVLGSGVANSGGSFAVAAAVALNTTNFISASATDVAGNVSGCSSSLVYVHDSIPPAVPALTGTSPGSPSNFSTTPSLQGTTEASATVKLFTNLFCTGAPVATGNASGSGTFSLGVSVNANSSTTFFATATDAAGNVSGCSAGLTYVHDSLPPGAPTLSGTSPASPSNSSTSLTLQGTAEANATVQLFTSATCAGTPLATGPATGSGAFSLGATVAANSSTTFFANARDAAGNVSACSAGMTYVHDSLPPAVPVLSGTSPTSPSNSSTTSVLGTTEGNATVRLFTNATCSGAAAAAGSAASSGAFSLAVTVAANSSTTFFANAQDAAGNVSACSSAGINYVEDNTAPPIPVLSGTTPASPSNSSTTPILQGTAVANGTVQLFTNPTCSGAAVATGTATPSGTFGVGVTVAANSSTTFFATAMSLAGNPSACSAGLTYVHDSIAPAAPVLSVFAPASGSTSTAPSVQGSAEAGATVKLFTTSGCTGAAVGSGTASPGGSFSVGATVSGGSATSFFATATDAAGNPSTCSSGLTFVSCISGTADCDGNPANVCEVTLASDVQNCGACGHACAGAPNAGATCSASTCGFTCNPGFSDCDGNPANGCETAGACPPPCAIDLTRELFIRDPLVVEDPVRTTGSGAWTFGKLMTDMAGGPQNVSNFVLTWLNTWNSDQLVNGFTVSGRPNIQNVVIGPWQSVSGGPANPLDMTRAPFRLLAIVNRIDLRNLPNNAGEGRFVFGVLDGSGNPLQFTVILEYKLPGTTAADVTTWAQRWHGLSQTPITDPTFNGKLQAITDLFAGANLVAGAPNGSAISQVRSNELALGPIWQLREFHLATSGLLVTATVAQTPDINTLNNSATLASFINQNSAAILAGTFTVPATFNGQNFLGGSADMQSPSVFWQAPGIQNNDARQQLSLNACNGCHAGETGTTFLHVQPRSLHQTSQLSGFLTGITRPDPVSGTSRSFNDLQRRSDDLKSLVCPAGSAIRTASGVDTAFARTSPDEASVGAGRPTAFSPTLPRSRVH